jgi:hypothetical protein
VYTHFDLRLVEITPTGASLVRETLPPSLAPVFPVEGGIGHAGLVRALICLSDLDKGLLKAVQLLRDLFVADMQEKLGPAAQTDAAVVFLRSLVISLGCSKHRRDNLHGDALALYNVLQEINSMAMYDRISTEAPKKVLDTATGGRPAENVFPVHAYSKFPGVTRGDNAASLAEGVWTRSQTARTSTNIVDLALSIVRDAKVRYENNTELIRLAHRANRFVARIC